MKLKNKKRLSMSLCLIILVCSLVIAMPVSAAKWQGAGTKASPYLVETPAQLNAMRENLSAHYKLANTIDMASFGKMEPIGYQGEKFTGSFTCDINSDGTPKYVIKNLKIYINNGEKYGHKLNNAASYVDFVQGKNKWQAGLFGWTEGASIRNIAVLNADVTNTVVGQNSAEKGNYKPIPGSDKTQSTGILIGTAVKTDVFGCVSSGKINAKNNFTGGLIGAAKEGSITNCYSTASVTSSGYWYTGGLIGMCDANVSCCFATGDVKGGPTEANNGGLIGAVAEGSTTMVTSCYSTGNVSPEANAFSFIGYRVTFLAHKENMKERTQNILNCFTTGSVAGYSKVQTGDGIIENNNYILSTSKGRQDYFKAATMDEIKKGLATCSDYDVSGDMPRLKNVAIITDESKYVPGKVSEVATNATQSETTQSETTNSSLEASSNVSSSETSDVSSENEQKVNASVKKVRELIEKLPQALEITIENKDAVKEAKRAYDALTAEQKLELPIDVATKITEIYNQSSTIILKQLRKDINEIPELSKLKADDYDKVMAIYDDYEFLSEDTRSFLKDDVKNKLFDAVEKVKTLKEGGEEDVNSVSSIEIAFIIVLSVLIVLVLAFNVVWSIWVIKKNKSLTEKMDFEEN